jgi:uncharacterized protein YcaQ
MRKRVSGLTMDDLRRFAVCRSLFRPTTLRRALERLKFVQADPIRAPARAQDLILAQRVTRYCAGDLESQYESLGIEDDFFTTYGFVTRSLHQLMHPRPQVRVPAQGNQRLAATERNRERLLLQFIRKRGAVHPRAVEKHFSHGKVRNYWGGSSHATTQMLDGLHYRGLLRVVRREKGTRVYEIRPRAPELDRPIRNRLDALVDVAVNIYGPMPAPSLNYYVRRLRYAVPQWAGEISGALDRARERLAHATVKGVDWYWPNGENPRTAAPLPGVRLLAPFDPVVHDRDRFELFWGWSYRFEAYTPAARRKLGYYALPLLRCDRVIGWANLAAKNGSLTTSFGYVDGRPPRDSSFKGELQRELERMRLFLGLG